MFKIIFLRFGLVACRIWRLRRRDAIYSLAQRLVRQEYRMPYSMEHKSETRQKILESARRLFNKKGYAEVSIDEIMENAGLTHGGFYRHFHDKAELYAETVRWFLCPEAPKPWQRKARDTAAEQKPRGQRVVDAYFSRDHFNDRESCCPLITQTSDVARGSDTMKGAYREVVEKLVEIFQSDVDEPEKQERALAMVALCVGGVIVARCIDDPVLADGLRRAAHRHALRTGGWDNSPTG
jgi:TetR/AcrR family transcriptional regulator, transcriptional repressor for nem operon